jgi:hypothetical protein
VIFGRFDFPARPATGKLACDETKKAHEKTGCGAAMDAHDFAGTKATQNLVHLFHSPKKPLLLLWLLLLWREDGVRT